MELNLSLSKCNIMAEGFRFMPLGLVRCMKHIWCQSWACRSWHGYDWVPRLSKRRSEKRLRTTRNLFRTACSGDGRRERERKHKAPRRKKQEKKKPKTRKTKCGAPRKRKRKKKKHNCRHKAPRKKRKEKKKEKKEKKQLNSKKKKRHVKKEKKARKSKKKVFAHCMALSLCCQLIFGVVKKEFKLIIMVKAWVLMTRAFLEEYNWK